MVSFPGMILQSGLASDMWTGTAFANEILLRPVFRRSRALGEVQSRASDALEMFFGASIVITAASAGCPQIEPGDRLQRVMVRTHWSP